VKSVGRLERKNQDQADDQDGDGDIRGRDWKASESIALRPFCLNHRADFRFRLRVELVRS
jgi:hypothetical protein